MNGRDVFTPAEPHRCDPPDGRSTGSIWQCSCGRYFYVFEQYLNDLATPPVWLALWTPVRWWNRRERRIIAADRGGNR